MQLNINQQNIHIDIPNADTPLLWILRDHLHLAATKYGCGIGACDYCIVLIDGTAMHSCLPDYGEID